MRRLTNFLGLSRQQGVSAASIENYQANWSTEFRRRVFAGTAEDQVRAARLSAHLPRHSSRNRRSGASNFSGHPTQPDHRQVRPAIE